MIREPRPPAPLFKLAHPPIYVCHPNRLTCRYGHVRRDYRECATQQDQRRLDGHLFRRCDECGSCYLGVFYALRGKDCKAIVHCYEISPEQLSWWNTEEGASFPLDEEQPTPHMLHLLGYEPNYRPTNPATNRPTPRS